MKLAIVAAVVAIVAAAALLLTTPPDSNSETKAVMSGSDNPTAHPLNATQANTTANKTMPADNATMGAPEGEYYMSIYVDRHTYAPRDPVNLTMNITVPGRIENAEIRFFGVKNKFGAYKLQRSMVMTLVEGINVINTRTDIPSCTSCSGLSVPAAYQIHGAVYYNGDQLVNATTEIEIKEDEP